MVSEPPIRDNVNSQYVDFSYHIQFDTPLEGPFESIEIREDMVYTGITKRFMK